MNFNEKAFRQLSELCGQINHDNPRPTDGQVKNRFSFHLNCHFPLSVWSFEGGKVYGGEKVWQFSLITCSFCMQINSLQNQYFPLLLSFFLLSLQAHSHTTRSGMRSEKYVSEFSFFNSCVCFFFLCFFDKFSFQKIWHNH